MYGRTGVVAIYSMLIVLFNNDPADICYQTVPRTPEMFTSLLHICDLRSRTTIEVLLIPPCITAIETSHKQKEDV